MKSCYQCKIKKELSEFYDNPKNKDGKTSYCKDCTKEHSRNWFKSEKGRECSLKQTRKWSKTIKGKKYIKEYDKNRLKTSPEKIWCRNKLRDWVYNKRIQKPDVCQNCNKTYSKNLIQGHHKVYEIWYTLDMSWLEIVPREIFLCKL